MLRRERHYSPEIHDGDSNVGDDISCFLRKYITKQSHENESCVNVRIVHDKKSPGSRAPHYVSERKAKPSVSSSSHIVFLCQAEALSCM